MVQFDFVDHYNNNTLKVVSIIGYILWRLDGATSAEHIAIIDDDSYLNIPRLYEELYLQVKNQIIHKTAAFPRHHRSSIESEQVGKFKLIEDI